MIAHETERELHAAWMRFKVTSKAEARKVLSRYIVPYLKTNGYALIVEGGGWRMVDRNGEDVKPHDDILEVLDYPVYPGSATTLGSLMESANYVFR